MEECAKSVMFANAVLNRHRDPLRSCGRFLGLPNWDETPYGEAQQRATRSAKTDAPTTPAMLENWTRNRPIGGLKRIWTSQRIDTDIVRTRQCGLTGQPVGDISPVGKGMNELGFSALATSPRRAIKSCCCSPAGIRPDRIRP